MSYVIYKNRSKITINNTVILVTNWYSPYNFKRYITMSREYLPLVKEYCDSKFTIENTLKKKIMNVQLNYLMTIIS